MVARIRGERKQGIEPLVAVEPSFSAHTSLTERIMAVAGRSGPSTFLRLLSAEGIPTELSYMELMEQASIWTEIYKRHDLMPRQRVVILISHSVDSYAAFLGAIVGGLIPAMLPPPSPKLSKERFEETVAALLPAIEPDAVVVGAELHDTKRSTARTAVISAAETLKVHASQDLTMMASGQGEDLAFLQYSSGTTGLRKGVTVSHTACLKQVDLYGTAIGLGQDDSIVSWLPLYHDMGLLACWMLPLLTGTPVTVMSPFDWIGRPSMLVRAIRAYRPSLCWLPNFAFSHLARAVPDAELGASDLSSIRAFINCSEPIRQSAHDSFLSKFSKAGARADQIATCYAMAEATFAVTSSEPGKAPKTLEVDPDSLGAGSAVQPGPMTLVSSGRPIGETTVRAVDDHGRTLPDAVMGHLRVSSPTLTLGYLANPDATRAAFVNDELHTGDIGFVADGEVFVLGRSDDMIIAAGRNIFPQDIEAVVDSVPGVVPGRSVAFGISDDREGTSHIVVIAETDITDDRSGLGRWISAELVARLDVSPRAIRIVDRGWLVKSTSGKISRRSNRERYLSELAPKSPTISAASKPPGNSPLVEFVRAAVSASLGREAPADDDSLIVSGQLDSLALTTLLLELGERYGERLPMPNVVGFHHFDSIDAIVRLLTEVEGGFVAQSRQMTYSARELKLKALASSSGDLDLLILGSSTSFPISCRVAATEGLAAFNLSVNAASVADIYCLMRLAADRRGAVKRVVVGLDVFAFKSKNAMVIDLRTLATPELAQYLRADDRAALAAFGEAATRASRSYRIALQRLAEWNPSFWYSFDGQNGDLIVGDLDAGSESGPLDPRKLDPAIHEMALVYGEDFDRVCPKQAAYLQSIVDFASNAGVHVDFVVMPIHPQLHAFLTDKTVYSARRADVIDLIASLSSATVRLHDLPTPDAFGGDNQDFVDPYHIGTLNGERLLRQILLG